MTTAEWVLRSISQTTKIKGPFVLPDQSQMSKTYLPEMSFQNTKQYLAVKSAGQKAVTAITVSVQTCKTSPNRTTHFLSCECIRLDNKSRQCLHAVKRCVLQEIFIFSPIKHNNTCITYL